MFLVLIFGLPCLIFAHIGYSTQSYCLDEINTDKLLLQCPDNQLIKIGRIIYGYSWSNDCSYIDKDCTMDVPREDIVCSTISNCTVRVVEHPLILQDCWNLAASYIQAEYECLRDYSLTNICQSQDLTLSHGFLSTPNYPYGFLSNLNCLCTLVASPDHSIVLEIINFYLPTCAEAGLLLWIGQDSQTKCLTQEPVTLVSSIQQNVTFRFYTLKTTNKQAGFLMKYSVLPESNNATVRLQCYVASSSSSSMNRSIISNSLLASKYFRQSPNLFNHENEKESSVTHSDDFSKRLRPITSMIETYSDLLPANRPQQSQGLNQSIYKQYLLPNSTTFSSSNINLIIIFIVAVIVFLIIINVLLWFMCSLRLNSSKSTSSVENLCSHKMHLNKKPKSPIHHELGQSSNRLKTLHSLLYLDHRTVDINPIKTNLSRDIDSCLSEYHIPSHSTSTSVNHDFIIKSQSNEITDEPRQINSWDDI
ncbi:unnamed protein product [Rotaria magnacalcarata]|uniref:CUB domain-containing protein n=2 Tax=Rotaria magnacalcarata TaxID=392030 RepID=A0A816ULR0_9BILA|nr:unnamed protein product [Rotaria magnacalcarata]CAF1577961.1 unnamed protein product [Rotaria magnacalcarata]CAF2109501.1 unnamed protein product [Rotaria magnacalcarata]